MLMKYERPPDGGWGWMVTFATCLAYASWGVPRGFSVLFDNFKDNFQATNAETSWINSLIGGFLLYGTLIGSVLNTAFGARLTMMTGGFLSCGGMVILSQSNVLGTAYLGSVIAGVGFGFAYCSGSSQIGLYFDKKRSLAFGIAALGAPASSTLMPLLLQGLTDTYGWRGAVLILGGVCLHLVVGGALLRPVFVMSGFQPEETCRKDTMELKVPLDEIKADKILLAIIELKKNVDLQNSEILDEMQYPSIDRLSFLDALSISNLNLHKCSNEMSNLRKLRDEKISNSLPHLSPSEQIRLISNCNSLPRTITQITQVQKETSEKKTFVDSSTIVSQKEDRSKKETPSIIITPAISKGSLNIKFPQMSEHSRFAIFMKPYLSLLKQWRFMLFCLVGFLDFAVRLTPASFIVVHAHSQGLSEEDGALLLVIFAVFDTIIRPISGFVTNKIPEENLRKGVEIFAFGCAQFILFALNVAASFASKFIGFAVYMVVYGIANGLNSSWCFPILSRLVPLGHLRHAIGIFHCICGFGFIGGPPLAGFLADFTGHYHVVFYFASVTILFSCAFAWLLYGLTRKFGLRKLQITLQKNENAIMIAK